jgi:Flp pilus assembly protein TadD
MLSLFKRNTVSSSQPAPERPSGAYGVRRASRPSSARISRARDAREEAKRNADAQHPVADPRDAAKEALAGALHMRRHEEALQQIQTLMALDPSDPRWPHKYGDVLRSLGRRTEAAAAFRRAARRYEIFGFPLRAQAMVRLACELEVP